MLFLILYHYYGAGHVRWVLSTLLLIPLSPFCMASLKLFVYIPPNFFQLLSRHLSMCLISLITEQIFTPISHESIRQSFPGKMRSKRLPIKKRSSNQKTHQRTPLYSQLLMYKSITSVVCTKVSVHDFWYPRRETPRVQRSLSSIHPAESHRVSRLVTNSLLVEFFVV